ncbi:hypothetical protein B0A55_02998 [Friedmanniomyces simplex]|uniref:Uncharacterized protein n=1 Tax=Friedmanniomyces simplex TaxID=329884 RepID=A0A4U0Y1X4_9PEZI|nr:hypothetical protein B0A55_02998 [Friedmanniomyces simplex]
MLAPSRYPDHSTATTSTTTTNVFALRPPIPSPLSPRSANIHGRYPAYMSSSPSSGDKTPQPQVQPHPQYQQHNGKQAWAKRPVKKAPSPRQDDLKETRRRLFLRNVREGREDRRWAQRGEDIMRLDFVQRQRAWEAEQARDARYLGTEPIEEEDEGEEEAALYELPSSSSNTAMQMSSHPASQQQPMPEQEEELEAVLQREQEEMEALLSYMPMHEQEGSGMEGVHDAQSAGNLWSDDDDYDALFSEVMIDQSGNSGNIIMGQGQITQANQSDEEMDLS